MRSEEYELHAHLFPRPGDSLALCAKCTLCQQAGLGFVATEIVWGNGPKNARLMVIGNASADGKECEPLWKGSKYTLMPLTNKDTGAKLRILLYRAGVDPFSVFITNTVKCNVGYDKDHPSYAKKVSECLQHLREEIATLRPQVVVPLGEVVAERARGMLKYRRPLRVDGLEPTEMLSKYLPFVGSLTETGQSEMEVFPLKHPCRVKGKAERRYQHNLEVIAARLR